MTRDDQNLAIYSYGPKTAAPALIIAHGLFGSGRNWRALAKRFSADRQVIAVDMRNHGSSFWHDSQTYVDMAEDLAKVVAMQEGPCDLLGHSMGGKAAMVMALHFPEKLHRLIIADIAPVGYAHSQSPNIRVMQGVDLKQVQRRSDADIQMRDQIAEQSLRDFLLQSLEITADAARWQLNLTALEANMDAIIGFPKVNGQFDNPTQFIVGGASDYVMPQHHDQILRLFPNAEFATLPGAGHWVHAQAPRQFIAAVEEFISR